MSQQTDRTRTVLAMLADGNKLVDVADHLGTTCSAVCQRRKRAQRDWAVFQGQNGNGTSHPQKAP